MATNTLLISFPMLRGGPRSAPVPTGFGQPTFTKTRPAGSRRSWMPRTRSPTLPTTPTTAWPALRFAGQLSKPAGVTVNGVAATVDSRSRFEAKVNLNPGPQTVAIVATDPSDNSTVTHNYRVDLTGGSPRNYTRDSNGNITSSTSPDGTGAPNAFYEWDAADRLTVINLGSHRTEIEYDGLGRRVHLTERDSGNVTSEKRFVWCGDEPCEERDASGATVKKRFFGQGEQRIGGSDAGLYFYTRDHLGSIRELTDASGTVRARYDYNVWGQRTKLSGNLDSDLGFTGFYLHSPSGLDFSRTRGYDSLLGKWISRIQCARRAD